MAVDLKGRNFLTLRDFTAEEISHYLELAAQLKADKKNGTMKKYMEGKNIALIFEKPSTRTRCSFVVACNDMGAFPEYLGKGDIQLGKESVEDTARVLGRMFDGIEFRGFSQKVVEDLAKYSGVPVWNGLTDEDHPTQILADFLTIQEHLGKLKGVKLVYMGDGRNNMANALLLSVLQRNFSQKKALLKSVKRMLNSQVHQLLLLLMLLKLLKMLTYSILMYGAQWVKKIRRRKELLSFLHTRLIAMLWL